MALFRSVCRIKMGGGEKKNRIGKKEKSAKGSISTYQVVVNGMLYVR